MPKNTATLKRFKRYSKFYLQGLVEGEDNICWRVEAIDSYSTPGILEITAVEYYANEHEDDIENGKVGALITKPIDPNIGTSSEYVILGETFIKPKKEYIYYYFSSQKDGHIRPSTQKFVQRYYIFMNYANIFRKKYFFFEFSHFFTCFYPFQNKNK